MREQLNIIITGKSGVGKSSFLNYLVGKQVFEVGDGNPITQQYFDSVKYTSPNSVVYNLQDTKGIEPTTSAEHRDTIFHKIKKCDQSNNVFEWIHTVYYCFSASSKRIEQFEISFIKELMEKVTVVLLLTKKDLVTDSDLLMLKKQIYEEFGTEIQVIPVCSVREVTRKGKTNPEGREEVLKISFLGLWNNLASKIPFEISHKLKENSTDVDLHGHKVLTKKWEQIFKRKQYKLYLKDLFNFPSLKKLELNGLTKKDIIVLKSLLRGIEMLLRGVAEKLDEVLVESKEIQKSILFFYEKIYGEKMKNLFSDLSENKMRNILRLLSEEKNIYEVNRVKSSLLNSTLESMILSVVFMPRKIITQAAYKEFTINLSNSMERLFSELSEFEEIYKTELYNYGQYCIREIDKELKVENSMINNLNELTRDEQKYLQLLKEYLSNGNIDEKKRIEIDRFRRVLNIKDVRAGLIEDFLRSTL